MLKLLKYIATRHAYYIYGDTVIINGKWFDKVNKYTPREVDDPSIIIHEITKCKYMLFDDQPDYFFGWNKKQECYTAN